MGAAGQVAAHRSLGGRDLGSLRRRLTKSGVMAAMRRALESCPDAGREQALPLESLDHSSPAELLALRLRIEMASAERGSEPGGDRSVGMGPYVAARGDRRRRSGNV